MLITSNNLLSNVLILILASCCCCRRRRSRVEISVDEAIFQADDRMLHKAGS